MHLFVVVVFFFRKTGFNTISACLGGKVYQ